jgi:hypothetical protein
MSTVVAFLLAFFKFFPAAKDAWEELYLAYLEKTYESWRKERKDALRNSILTKDQRDFEKAIGNPNAGKPVYERDSEIVDSLPGIDPHK